MKINYQTVVHIGWDIFNPTLWARTYSVRSKMGINRFPAPVIQYTQYYPAVGRFTTVDPLCEKYYSISPYAYCAGNPVNRIDPDGMYVVGIDGKPVTYDIKNGWSTNASPDVQKIGNAMMLTPEGKSVFDNMQSAKYGIKMNYKDGFNTDDKNKLGEAIISVNKENGDINEVTINLFDGKLQESVNIYQGVKDGNWTIKNPTETSQLLSTQTPSLPERIGQVGAHEGTHATNTKAMSHVVGKEKAETTAIAVERKVIQQTTEYNRQIQVKISPIIIKPINKN